jgi:hypothetical protein
MRKLKIAAAALVAVALVSIAALLPNRAEAQQADISSAWLLQFENRFPNIGAYPPGAVATNASSGNVAAATATATLAAVAAKTNYIVGVDVNGGGATAASIISCTITGLIGGTATFSLPIPAGVAVGLTPLSIRFPEPLPASAVNVAIVASCPTFGSGNTNATVNAYGFVTAATP